VNSPIESTRESASPSTPPAAPQSNAQSGAKPASGIEHRGGAKPIHWFVLQAAMGLLLLGWVTAGSSWYPRAIQLQANALFAWSGTERWLEFEWVDPESRLDRSDTLMLGMTKDSADEGQRRWRAVFSVRRRGFWPLATWLAVMLATPMSMASRFRGLGVGALALHLLLMCQIALIATCAFGATEPQASPLWDRGAAIATALFNSPVPTYALVFVLWAWLANPAQGIAVSGTVAQLRRWVRLAVTGESRQA
jgi:hypothetical protein